MFNFLKKLFHLPKRIENSRKVIEISSISDNFKVHHLNHIIVESEDEIDYYWEYGGNIPIQELLQKFSKEDWLDLKEDIKNWKSHQLTILADAILCEKSFTGYDVYLMYGYIFLIVNDSDAEILIGNIHVLGYGNQKADNFFPDILLRIENISSIDQDSKNFYVSIINSLM